MNLHKLIFTENACYKAGKKIKPKGIMVHSTGANNPKLSRYVGPDDGKLGANKYGNHWNRAMSREVCVHAFIGKLADGSVATYQTLPWEHRGWHCGKGKKGSGNDTHISFEICEDGLTDAAYFGKVYTEAVELCVYLCKLYGLTAADIIDHSEGYKQGIASNHGDVKHWFTKHGKSMDTFRADVKALLDKEQAAAAENSVDAVARSIAASLTAAGYDPAEVGKRIIELKEAAALDKVAKDVIRGKYGNGAERKAKLIAEGYDPQKVQQRVNELLKG